MSSPDPSLASLPRLLRNDPALTQALGDPSGFVAVPEAVTKPSRELDASARFGTELIVSLSIRICMCQPSRLTLS